MKASATIVVGPPRSGKTLNCKTIAKALGCSAVYDDGDYALKEATGPVLVLAHRPPRDPNDRRRLMRGKIITIEDAKQLCGDDWIEPKI